MSRKRRPLKTTRSEHWLRVAVNERTHLLNSAIATTFGWSADEKIRWLSPISSDDFAEYSDEAFLKRLGLEGLATPLTKFWPERGPNWDGLARTDSGKVILVEAKAHIEEMVDFSSKASSPASLAMIECSLEMAKVAYGARHDAPWPKPLFQFANRLAHLYFLVKMNRIDAYLVFLSFADAPDVPRPATIQQWEGAHRLALRCLGLSAHPYRGRVGHTTLSVPGALLSVAAGEHGVAPDDRPQTAARG